MTSNLAYMSTAFPVCHGGRGRGREREEIEKRGGEYTIFSLS